MFVAKFETADAD